MKEIKIYTLGGDPKTVNFSLGYDACLDGFDPEVNSSEELQQAIAFVTDDDSHYPMEVPIVMHAPLRGIQGKDILSCEPSNWLPISGRFRELLNSPPFDSMEKEFVPTRIYDGEIQSGEDPRKPAQRFTDDYTILYLPKSLKIFDYHKSDYLATMIDDEGDYVAVESEFATKRQKDILTKQQKPIALTTTITLKIREAELPPIFRLAALPTDIFLSEAGLKLVEKAKLKNIWAMENAYPVLVEE